MFDIDGLYMNFFLQNYSAGNPASILYIKNLAKDVVADDFYFIFGEIILFFYFIFLLTTQI